MNRYKKSLEYLERAKKVIPGAAQTLSKSYKRFPQGAFPVAVKYGCGARIWDVDGNEYVDWIGALGAIPLGYQHPRVTDFVEDQGSIGGAFSLPHSLELKLAERLCAKIPCAEMARFVNSGSEATEAAIRTARIATGRDIILTVKNGYHSWFSWFQAVKNWHPGVPQEYEYSIRGLQYNNLESWEHVIANTSNVAAVILEPCLFEKPQKGFLEGIRELCNEFGIVLIFDEMVLGFRLALAGGQEYFKVTPDLATFGKGMANGLPIGMLCGKREYMQHAELISGTFGGNAVSLAAADAVLDVYESEDVIGKMWRDGLKFQLHFNNLSFLKGMDSYVRCNGYPVKPRIVFNTGDVDIDLKAMSLLLQECAVHGVLLHYGGMNVCYALTEEDMNVTFRALNISLDRVKLCIDRQDWSLLIGQPIIPVVTVRK